MQDDDHGPFSMSRVDRKVWLLVAVIAAIGALLFPTLAH